MNKRYIKLMNVFCITLCTAMLFCGCEKTGNKDADMNDDNNRYGMNETADDKKDGEVRITLPASMFESIDAAKEEAKQILNGEGVISAETAEDGSVNIVMSSEGHKKTLEDLKKSVNETADEMQKDEGSDTIKKVSLKEDLSEAEVTVTSEEDYKASGDNFSVFALGLKMLYYRRYTGDENAKASVKIRDEKTDKIFDTKIYPQELSL